jgi:2-amino-4-hydroxy-6-hydroxymethyldihydropteridine diphosphokinase
MTALGAALKDMRRASFYETEPLHVADQARFLNTAVAGFYPGSPWELLAFIHKTEAAFERDRSKERRWGERTLDIDILIFGDTSVSVPPPGEPSLEIPHPRLCERQFALLPLVELLPEARDPRTGILFRAVLDGLPPQGVSGY